MRKYYTLLIKDGLPGMPWLIAFGDYDRETVAAELDGYRDDGWKRSELRIIATGARQFEIQAAVDKINNY